MRRTAITTSLSTEVMRRLRHFGDFVTVPLVLAPALVRFRKRTVPTEAALEGSEG